MYGRVGHRGTPELTLPAGSHFLYLLSPHLSNPQACDLVGVLDLGNFFALVKLGLLQLCQQLVGYSEVQFGKVRG